MSGGAEHRLILAAGRDVVIAQAHQPHPGTYERRHRKIFTERHQVSLVIPTISCAAQHQQPIVKLPGLRLEAQQSDCKIRAVRAARRVQIPQVIRNVVGEHRQRGFRPHDDPRAPSLGSKVRISGERRVAIVGLPLLVLRDGSLHGGHGDRRSRRPRPVMARGNRRDQEQGREHCGGNQSSRRRHRHPQQHIHGNDGHDRGPGHAIDSEQRRPCRQWRIDERIAQRQPGKAAQCPATQPLKQYPQHRQHQPIAGRQRLEPESIRQVAQRRAIRRHRRDQCRHQYESQPNRHQAETVQAGIQPVGAAAEKTGAERGARPRGAARRQASD